MTYISPDSFCTGVLFGHLRVLARPKYHSNKDHPYRDCNEQSFVLVNVEIQHQGFAHKASVVSLENDIILLDFLFNSVHSAQMCCGRNA